VSAARQISMARSEPAFWTTSFRKAEVSKMGDHRRWSATRSRTGPSVRTGTGRRRSRRPTRGGASRPAATGRSWALVRSMGTTRATGVPRSVTIGSSPDRTRSIHLPSPARSSRIPTSSSRRGGITGRGRTLGVVEPAVPRAFWSCCHGVLDSRFRPGRRRPGKGQAIKLGSPVSHSNHMEPGYGVLEPC
jgi:hypothetical protein